MDRKEKIKSLLKDIGLDDYFGYPIEPIIREVSFNHLVAEIKSGYLVDIGNLSKIVMNWKGL